MACGILAAPPGIKPLQWKGGVLPTGLPGKSCSVFLQELYLWDNRGLSHIPFKKLKVWNLTFPKIWEFRCFHLRSFTQLPSTMSSFCTQYFEKINEGFSPFLSSADLLQMGFKTWIISVAFPTFLTLIGFLSSVNPNMSLKIWGPMEGFPTLLTFIGFLSSMNPDMPVEGRSTWKGFST